MLEKLSKSRLIFVTGKGGVGKSIISASLGMAFHNVGHRPLLVEFFPDKRLEHIFKLNAEIYRETEIKKDFNYINISSSEALAEYIRGQLILDTISKFVLNTKFYRYLSSTAPGLKELVAIGKLYDLEKKRDNDGNYLYDPIIVDAPQLGKFIPFIKTPQTIMNMFKIGPVKKEAEKVNSLICSNKSAVVIVSTGDKMAISETIEAKKELFSIKYPVVRLIIINMAISEKISTLDNKYYEQRLNDILTNNNIKDELMPAIEKLINYVTLEKTAINELVTNTDNVPILILPLIKNTDDELLITEELSHYFTA